MNLLILQLTCTSIRNMEYLTTRWRHNLWILLRTIWWLSTNVPEAWNTTFHSDETRAIISDMILSPPVIRKLTYCSQRELRAHAQEVNHYGHNLDEYLVAITDRISFKWDFQSLWLLLDVQQHGKWRFIIELQHWWWRLRRCRWHCCTGAVNEHMTASTNSSVV